MKHFYRSRFTPPGPSVTSRVLFLLLLLFLVTVSEGIYTTLRIESIKSSKAPRIEEKRLIYTLDAKFNERPKNYWSYFDKKSNSIVIDCYDTWLDSLPASILVSTPFTGVDITNTEAKKTVTGKLAKFSINLDSLWYYKIDPVDNNVLRLTVWKYFKERGTKKEKKNLTIAYLAVGGLTAALTFAIILLTTQR
ncbi:MAG: hypothetical protein GF401_13070 [Chitinivibrionales bacterium]|nr:hypothetical protein [Chitinivibrionales bacterium]